MNSLTSVKPDLFSVDISGTLINGMKNPDYFRMERDRNFVPERKG
jgi:hypothetical protein